MEFCPSECNWVIYHKTSIIGMDRSEQTVHIKIRWLLKEQSGEDPHLWTHYIEKPECFICRTMQSNGVDMLYLVQFLSY